MAIRFLHEKMPQVLTNPMAFDVNMMIEKPGLSVIEYEIYFEKIMRMTTFIDSNIHTEDGVLCL